MAVGKRLFVLLLLALLALAILPSAALAAEKQTVTFTSPAPPNATVGGPTYSVTATGGGSQKPVILSIPASSASVCSISPPSAPFNGTVSFTGEGTCIIEATQEAEGEFEAGKAEPPQEIPVKRKTQEVTIESEPPKPALVGGTYVVKASATSPLGVTVSAAPESVCTASGTTVEFKSAGQCTVTASQAGNNEYEGATSKPQLFTVEAPSSGGSSSSGSSISNTQPPASTTAVITSTPPPPKGGFKAVSAMLHSPSYVITLNESLDEAGTLSWLVTFPNGPLGAYTAKNKKCRAGRIRLVGRCLPAKVLFGRGKQTFSAPGIVTITIKPTRAAKRAFKNAKRKHRNIKLTATLTFTSLRGGAPVVHTQVLTIRLARSK
jgi:hypothetical protein